MKAKKKSAATTNFGEGGVYGITSAEMTSIWVDRRNKLVGDGSGKVGRVRLMCTDGVHRCIPTERWECLKCEG